MCVCINSDLFLTVKQAGRDFTYLIVVLVGLGVTGHVHDKIRWSISFIVNNAAVVTSLVELCTAALTIVLFIIILAILQEDFCTSSFKNFSHPRVRTKFTERLLKNASHILRCVWTNTANEIRFSFIYFSRLLNHSHAFDLVFDSWFISQVIGAFGEPIKCYGETTRRGRRQHVRWGRLFISLKP